MESLLCASGLLFYRLCCSKQRLDRIACLCLCCCVSHLDLFACVQLELSVEMLKKAEAEAKAKAAAASTYTGYFSGWLGGKPAAVSRSEYLLTVCSFPLVTADSVALLFSCSVSSVSLASGPTCVVHRILEWSPLSVCACPVALMNLLFQDLL